jgi:hypothetical protein
MWPSRFNHTGKNPVWTHRAKSNTLNTSMRVGNKIEKIESTRGLVKHKAVVPPLANLTSALLTTGDRMFTS